MDYWYSITRYLRRDHIRSPRSGKEFILIKILENPLYEFVCLMLIAAGMQWSAHRESNRITLLENTVADQALAQAEEETRLSGNFDLDRARSNRVSDVENQLESVKAGLANVEKRSVIILTPTPVPSPAASEEHKCTFTGAIDTGGSSSAISFPITYKMNW